MRQLEIWLASLPALAALIILTMAVCAPIMQATLGYPFGELGYHLLFSICHQYPLRSFWILDHPMALCARCTGGYSGVVIGLVISLSKYNHSRHRLSFPLVLGFSLFALGVDDAIFKTLTNIDGTNTWRLSTGLVGGAGLAILMGCRVFVTRVGVGPLNLQREAEMRPLLSAATLVVIALYGMPATAREVKIPAGTIVVIQTLSAISSETASADDLVELLVAADVFVQGTKVIAAGAEASGAIEQLESSEMLGQEGRIAMSINSAHAVDGTNVPLTGRLSSRGDDEMTGTVVGAIFCPLFLLLISQYNT